MDKIRVDGANGIRFSTRKIFSSSTIGLPPFSIGGGGGGGGGAFTNSSSAACDSMQQLRIPKTDINPNKAVFTIDSKTSNILIVNDKACQLLDYRPSELCDMKFAALLTNKTNKSYVSALAEGQLNSEDGTMVLLSGKVVEMTTKMGGKVAVSLWIRQIDADGRSLAVAVAEPVERRVAQIMADANGRIVSCDAETLMLFQIDTEDDVCGMDVKNLIPAIQLPSVEILAHQKTMYKQKATGKTRDNLSFPLCLMITTQAQQQQQQEKEAEQEQQQQPHNGDGDGDDDATAYENDIDTECSAAIDAANDLYVITIWVFQNISGLVVIDETGSIELCNHHFSMLMFGYAQSKITRLHITHLIPNFAQEHEYLGIGEWNYNSRSRNITFSSLDNESETETDPVYYEAESLYATPAEHTAASSDHSKSFNDNDVSVYEMSQANKTTTTSTTTTTGRGHIPIAATGDMSKAISEPIQIYLNCLLTDTVGPVNGNGGSSSSIMTKSIDINNELPTDVDGEELKSCTVAKSYSDNTLGTECTRANAKIITNHIDNTDNDHDDGDKNDIAGNQINRRHSQLLSHTINELNVPTRTTAIRRINKQTMEPSKLMDCDDETTSNCDAGELLTPVNETNVSERYLMESNAVAATAVTDRPDLSDTFNDLEIDATANEIGKTHKTSAAAAATAVAVPAIGHCKSAPPVAAAAQKSISNRRFSTAKIFTDGKYKGKGTHCDGNVFNIFYTISSQELPCGRRVYCVWICRDECDMDDDEDDGKHPNLTLTFNSITSNAELSIDGGMTMGTATTTAAAAATATGTSGTAGTAKRNSMNVQTNQSSRPNSVSLLSQYDDEQVSGEYNKHYTSLKQIGKGAFGYVKLSFRHNDRLLVVTKFILKDKLPPQFMVITDDKKEIPMEVYLLSTLKHPNIVTVLDVFENEKFFQLVMEKHGSGMDLFEFIDRRPLMDEQLGSYIFRQIVNAIDYLHSLKILHRDIKDENIIIDQYFHVKLIDFGSATFMVDGKLFSTFYGTTEYCSPEVLAGNKYAGPELEIWALGITLFVLIFFENPFIDIEETLHSELHFPHTVSPALEKTLSSMLDKNPKTRCTMKQLTQDPWVTQELQPCNFNFSWIVPCESHESNPDKYFTGQIYSSATGLSTTSPTSLADEEDSIIDDDIEDEELCDEACSNMHLHQQEFVDYRKCRKSNEILDIKDHEQPIDGTNDLSTTTNASKSVQLSISSANSLSPHVANVSCKRHSMNLSTLHHQQLADVRKSSSSSKCNCSSAPQCKRSTNERANFKDSGDLNVTCMKKESFSCDSISKTSYTAAAAASAASTATNPFTETNVNSLTINGSRSPNRFLATSSSSPSGNSNLTSSTTTGGTISPIISLSKSETNISESKIGDATNQNQLTIYNVVSLNNLHDNEPFFHRTLGDHPKNQCYASSSDDGLYNLNPKNHNQHHHHHHHSHIVTLTNPKVLTTVTVSMRNAADVSDKVF